MWFKMATHKGRQRVLPEVLDSLRRQSILDVRIQVYYNDYVPDDTEGVDRAIIGELGDLGDAGKFVQPEPGWNLYVDDDIVYPANYAEKMIGESIIQGCPTCVHGAVMHRNPVDYFKSRQVFHFTSAAGGRKVNVAGTGTLCVNNPDFDHTLCTLPNMADCYYALMCQQKKIPIFMVGRQYHWIHALDSGKSLWDSRGDGQHQADIIKSVKKWVIH